MELAVQKKRDRRFTLALFFLWAGVAACAPVGTSTGALDTPPAQDALASNQVSEDSRGSDGIVSSAATLTTDAQDRAASTRILSNPSAGVVGIELVEFPSGNQLVVRAKVPAEKVTTTRLSNPERIVFDLPPLVGARVKTATYDTQDAQFVSRIRVGAHPDKTRIVLDLPSKASSVITQVDNSPGAVVMNLIDSATAHVATLPSASIVPESLAKAAPSPELFAEAAVAKGAPASQAPVAASATAMKPVLRDLRFEEIGERRNQLVLDMEAAGFYSLKQTAPSEYILKLDNAVMDDSVAPTLVANPGSGKIRSVRVSEKDGATVLRIFAAPEVTLNADSRSGGILVSALAPSDALTADARGQFAPEVSPPAVAANKPAKSATTTEVAPAKPESKTEHAEVTTSAKPAASEDSELSALLPDENYHGRLISLDLQDTDIDNALRIIAEVSNLNIVTTQEVAGKVTLRLIDVPWDQALDVILKINSLGKVQEGNVVRIAPLEKLRSERETLKQAKIAEEQLEELKVRYIRVSYARAGDLKPLVENVVSERGSVTYDERSNQLIIKDTKTGVNRVVELVKKLDLRTPQVLLETQIVESKRDFIRQLGAQLGFSFKNSPATGNATGYNFPNSVDGNFNSNNLGSLTNSAPGFLDILFGSADGTRNLDVQLAAAENEGVARIVSRPSVATTNNKQATIKSVEKVRVKLPSGGNSVTVGQGAQGTGSNTATEAIEAGIILEVTPQASPDYYVLLDINAKSSTFTTSSNAEGIPSEIERSATSTILVSSGQTFVMGGIYKIRENIGFRGVPYLKDVPVLGHLFRFSDVQDSDEELLFFITPRIIEGSFDDAAMKASL